MTLKLSGDSKSEFTPMIWFFIFFTFCWAYISENGESTSSTLELNRNLIYRRDVGDFEPIRIHLDTSGIDSTRDSNFAAMYKKFTLQSIEMMESILKVNPVQGNLVIPSSVTECGTVSIPSEHHTTGISNADLVIYLQDDDEGGSYCQGGGGYNAVYCARDSNGRAIAGGIQVCPQILSINGTDFFEGHVQRNTLHELIHVLGVSQYHFNRYIDRSTGQLYDQYWQTFYERGHNVTKMITPKAVEEARRHFNCPSLNGLEIEDKHLSHVEYRIYYGDIMTKSNFYRSVVSNITLALLYDSSWYDVDWTKSVPLYFGKNAGCEFATNYCLNSGDPPTLNAAATYGTWCVEKVSYEWLCSPDRQVRSQCGKIETGLTLESYFQYWTSDSSKGNSRKYSDSCPFYYNYYGGAGETGWCFSEGNEYSTSNRYGEKTGNTSFCIDSKLLREGSSSSLNMNNYKGFCFPITCRYDENGNRKSIDISIRYNETHYENVNCLETEDGTTKQVNGFGGNLKCPDINVICEQLERNGSKKGKKKGSKKGSSNALFYVVLGSSILVGIVCMILLIGLLVCSIITIVLIVKTRNGDNHHHGVKL